MYPDVLDSMGKSPREFVGVHVHFEAVQLVDGPRLVASVLLQSAYEPVPKVELVLTTLLTRRELVRLPLPSLEDGRVVRARIPVRLERDEPPQLGVHLEGPEPRGRRVRTAWKLESNHGFQLEPSLRAPAIAGVSAPLTTTLLDLVWRPGQAVPSPPPPSLTAVPPMAPVRWCKACGFEGPRAELEYRRQCPQCDEPWL